MRTTHRLRLTLVSVSLSGSVIAAVFLAAALEYRELQIRAAEDVLVPALAQVFNENREQPSDPDLGEIVQADPGLSAGVFDAAGRPVRVMGRLPLSPVVGSGRTLFSGRPAVFLGERQNGRTGVVAVSWGRRDADLDRLNLVLAGIWAAVVLLIGAVTWLAAKATLLPLERLSKEAEDFSGTDLSRRLKVEDQAEFGQFAERLNRFLDRLESLVRHEERFVADAAHELRTPLTVLRGQIETTLQRPRSTEEYRSTMSKALEETERMSRLVELLLQSGRPLEPNVPAIDVEHALERLHARWVDRFHSKGVRLYLQTSSASANILEAEFDVVVENLLSNALKASPNDGSCWMTAEMTNGSAHIEVRDEGAGIPEHAAEAVFERFSRLDYGRNRSEGGVGIGLALCKRIVENRGGSISVRPTAPGATLVVELPLVGAFDGHL